MAEYPVFLGVAAYLVLSGVGISPFGLRPLDVVRYTAAVTLMWASVENSAFPEWSALLIAAKPVATMGRSPKLFMKSVGMIEFTLAFSLVWTPLVPRRSPPGCIIILYHRFRTLVFNFAVISVTMTLSVGEPVRRSGGG
jgi:hypothetical protein